MIPAAIADYLRVPTPQTWIESAVLNRDLLLIDHANCEKKAASTALSLLYRYVEKPDLLQRLSRLAREELRHFEQVARVIEMRGVAGVVDAGLEGLYRTLLDSEKRHFEEYRRLAVEYGDDKDIRARIDEILTTENHLVTTVDREFRFHSGPTVNRRSGPV